MLAFVILAVVAPLCQAVYYDGFTVTEPSDLCDLGTVNSLLMIPEYF